MRSSRALPPSSPAKVDAKKTRAKHACSECHSRRVRCDVTEKQPCSNCSLSGARCEVLPSRRGRYPRRSRRHHQHSSDGLETPPSESGHIGVAKGPPSGEAVSSLTLGTPAHTANSHSDVQDDASQQGERQIRCATPPCSSAPAAGTLFFGESNFLTLVPRDDGILARTSTSGSQKPRLTFPIPTSPEDAGVSAGTMRYLRDEGALTPPDLQSCLPVLEAYFKWFHPGFPVLDRAEVTRRLASMDISPMLLQAMLFIGATYCDDEYITAMGFQDRTQAKMLLYTRTRLLFHADWEKDRIVLIQSLFLISFWRGGHADVRDVRYWLGVVITLAESYGLHRCTRSMAKDAHAAHIRRRIWWSIYRKERFAAASLGLPSRIREEDCDIEPLSPSDFESEMGCTNSPFGSCHPEHITYAIKMVEIGALLGRIIDLHFVPGRLAPTAAQVQNLSASLEAWKGGLPDNMRSLSDEGSDSVWTCLLHLTYNHHRILIHRNSFLRHEEGSEGSEVVLKAACRISRIAEDMSTQGTLRYAQMHLITSLFSALCIHTISIRRGTGVSRRIAENRAETCLLCLKEVQKYWRINNNVLDLFLRYLDRSIAARLHGSQSDSAVNEASGDADKSDVAMGSQDINPVTPSQGEASKDGSVLASGQPRAQDELFEEQYFNLVNGHCEGDAALGDLGLFLQADDLSQAGSGLHFLGRSL